MERYRHDHDIRDSSEKRRRASNLTPFWGEIPEHADRTQANTATKRRRRESNAAGLVQQGRDGPSNAPAPTKLRRASLSASRAVETMVSVDY